MILISKNVHVTFKRNQVNTSIKELIGSGCLELLTSITDRLSLAKRIA